VVPVAPAVCAPLRLPNPDAAAATTKRHPHFATVRSDDDADP